MDEDDDEYIEIEEIFDGVGSLEINEDQSGEEPRLWQFKSVSRAGALGLHKKIPSRPKNPIGFSIPKVKK